MLRAFSLEKAKEFYLGFLGFAVDWEHRFEPELPLYMQISRGRLIFDLSEHHGDGCPGANIRVEMTGVDEFHAEITAKKYNYGRPGIKEQEWGWRTVTAIDPFHNLIHFCERVK